METTVPFNRVALRQHMQALFDERNRAAPPALRDDPVAREGLLAMMVEMARKIAEMIQAFFRRLASYFRGGSPVQANEQAPESPAMSEFSDFSPQALEIAENAAGQAVDFSPESGFLDLPEEPIADLLGVKLSQLAANQVKSLKHAESLEDALYKRLKAACGVAGIKIAPEQLFEMVQTPFHQAMPDFIESLIKHDEGLQEAVQNLEYARAGHQVSQIALSDFVLYARENGLAESEIEKTLRTYGLNRSANEEAQLEYADREQSEGQDNVIRFPGPNERPRV